MVENVCLVLAYGNEQNTIYEIYIDQKVVKLTEPHRITQIVYIACLECDFAGGDLYPSEKGLCRPDKLTISKQDSTTREKSSDWHN